MQQVVLLPGLDGTGDLFAPLLGELSGRCVSTVVSYPRDVVRTTAQLLELISECAPAKGRYTVVAESFSGHLALLHALTNPERVERLVLVASFARDPMPRCMQVAARWLGPLLFRLPPPRAVLRQLLLTGSDDRQLLGAVQRAIQSVRPHVICSRLAQVQQPELNLDSQLSALKVPVTALVGTRDRLIGCRGHATLREVPCLSQLDIEGPHLLSQVCPGPVADAILIAPDA